MKLARRLSIGVANLLCLFFAGAVSAYPIPIPVGTVPTDDVLINFDFTGSTPAPPYGNMNFRIGLGGTHLDAIITMDIFSELGGAGSLIATDDFLTSGASIGAVGNLPGFLDGIFSVGLRLAGDPGREITGANAMGFSGGDDDPIAHILGEPADATVPEPATLVLLAAGLAGLGLARRRSRGSQTTAV